MACKDCENCKWNVIHTCKVCELLNKDFTAKAVCHCSGCGAYICKDHWSDYVSRGMAAFLALKDKVKEKVKDIIKRPGKKKFVTEDFSSTDETKADAS